ncbi:hypothetical protein PAPHI01_0603 [Pancytospora philotis]|nr:hypothetical protein PAPHI01_0603 [Pancytospora philotis]
MKINNFFHENIEVDSGCEDISAAIAEKYGIPEENQSIHRKNGRVTLFLTNNMHVSSETRLEIPAAVAELGCTQERFNYYYNTHGEAYMAALFPHMGLGRASKRSKASFGTKHASKDVEGLTKGLTPAQQSLIIDNLEDYIDDFLDL